MKRTTLAALLATAGALTLLSGCSSTPNADGQGGAGVENRGSDVATVRAGGVDGRGLYPELTDPKNILSKRSVYFDYDRFEIKPEYKDVVTAHAKFLGSHKDSRILVQGNTDERGSREYNLALGQKRADAVKKALTLLGAKEDQVESVSLGEEKPKNEGHDDAAWAENRRADVLYNGEY